MGAIENLTITVGGLIETHDTGGVLRGADERFPPSLFLRSTGLTTVNPAMETFARALRAESEDDTLGFLHTLMTQVNEHMTFDEDPTNSGTSAVEAFGLKRGVCQDYAHIFIACARSGGVPARFVSGHFLRSDGTVNQAAGHAWAEAYVPGPRLGRLRSRELHLHHAKPMPASPSASTTSVPHRYAAPAMAAAPRR